MCYFLSPGATCEPSTSSGLTTACACSCLPSCTLWHGSWSRVEQVIGILTQTWGYPTCQAHSKALGLGGAGRRTALGQTQAPPLRYLSWPTILLRCHCAGGSPGIWLKCRSSFRSCISDKPPGDADAEDLLKKKKGYFK